MSLAPVEIRHVKLARRLVGYDTTAADRLLEQITVSFEEVWRERADLREEIERLEGELARFKDLESLLRNTLLSAERAADELRAQARKESELIIEEARLRSREITSGAEEERERMRTDVRRLRELDTDMRANYRAFLQAALDRLESETGSIDAPHQAA
jgi:cell division initiation protein